jgi:enediyne biosynthesis thioesterase
MTSLAYAYHHTIAFEETNVVGNVYYVNYLRWQGRCRELFLRDHAPSVISEIADGLSIATVRVSCDFFSELHAFDEVRVEMRLRDRNQNRLSLEFDYWQEIPEGPRLSAHGMQDVAFMRRKGTTVAATDIPDELLRALEPYRAGAIP